MTAITFPPGVTATHTVEKIATFNKRDRSLCYWQAWNVCTTVHCESEKQANAIIARLVSEGRAVHQTVWGA